MGRRKRRRNSVGRILRYNGEEHSLVKWAEITGIPYTTLYNRVVKRGWPVKRALETKPINVGKRCYLNNAPDVDSVSVDENPLTAVKDDPKTTESSSSFTGKTVRIGKKEYSENDIIGLLQICESIFGDNDENRAS